jgi:hypothetical protein
MTEQDANVVTLQKENWAGRFLKEIKFFLDL